MIDDQPAPTREDLFGPLPKPGAGRDAPFHAALRRGLARALVGLAAPADPAEAARLIATLRREIDIAAARQRERVALHPMLEAWLPREVDAAVSVAELALLVESLAAAPAAERPAWARRLFRRCGHLAFEDLVALAEAGDGVRPVLETLMTADEIDAAAARMAAAIPPARVEARLALVLSAMDETQRHALLTALRPDGAEEARPGCGYGLAA